MNPNKMVSLFWDVPDTTPYEDIFLLNNLIENMGEPYTSILTLYLEGYSWEEITKKVKVSMSTVAKATRELDILWNQ